MGTEISLDIGGMSISCAKNDRGMDHGFLFQPGDRKRVRSRQVDYEEGDLEQSELAEMELGFTRPLRTILSRLELLGYTMVTAENEYVAMAEACREMDSETPLDLMPFEEFLAFLNTVAINDLDDNFVSDLNDTVIRGRFKDENQKARIPCYTQYNGGA